MSVRNPGIWTVLESGHCAAHQSSIKCKAIPQRRSARTETYTKYTSAKTVPIVGNRSRAGKKKRADSPQEPAPPKRFRLPGELPPGKLSAGHGLILRVGQVTAGSIVVPPCGKHRGPLLGVVRLAPNAPCARQEVSPAGRYAPLRFSECHRPPPSLHVGNKGKYTIVVRKRRALVAYNGEPPAARHAGGGGAPPVW